MGCLRVANVNKSTRNGALGADGLGSLCSGLSGENILVDSGMSSPAEKDIDVGVKISPLKNSEMPQHARDNLENHRKGLNLLGGFILIPLHILIQLLKV